MKKDFSISNVISEAFDVMNKNWMVFVAMMLLSGIVSSVFSSFSSLSPDYLAAVQSNDSEAMFAFLTSPSYCISNIISGLVSIVITTVVSRMALDATAGQKATFDAFKMPVNTYVTYFFTSLLCGIIIFIGCCLCILPGIFLAVKLAFAPYYVLDKGMGVMDAIKASWNDTTGNWWHLLGSEMLLGLVAMVGFLVCCVGMLYTGPVSTIGTCLLYRIISNSNTAVSSDEYNKSEY